MTHRHTPPAAEDTRQDMDSSKEYHGSTAATGTLTVLEGDNQSTDVGTFFPEYLCVGLTGASGEGSQVTFKLKGPATFDYDDDPTGGAKRISNTECVVMFIPGIPSYAYPPGVVAGNTPGTATCTATSSSASNVAKWNSLKAVGLETASGDTQTAPENTKFPLALDVQVVGVDDLTGAIVTFTLKGPATFDYVDAYPAGTRKIDDQKCTVPVLPTGHAVSPTVLAGSTSGTATATATSNVTSNTAKWDSLKVTPPVVNIPYYVSVYNDPSAPRCDLQDAIVLTDFAALQATVLDKNQQPVTNGNIIFNVGKTIGDAGILPVGEHNSQVASGLAIQSDVRAIVNAGPSDYATALVYAYPTDLSGKNLANQPANRYATYSLRVWSATSAIVTATAGTPQTTKPNTEFAQQLKAKVTQSDGSTAVPDLLISFTIVGGNASFELNTATVEPSSTSTTAYVRTDASGIATSPTVLAGANAANVTVTASAVVSSAPASYALSIQA